MRVMRSWYVATWVMLMPIAALAQTTANEFDRLTVRFIPGMVRSAEFETMNVQFQRFPSGDSITADRKADQFFDKIEKILATHGVSSSWQYVIPDGALIEIQIQTSGRVIKLASAHTLYERGGRLAATERGLRPLEGRKLNDIIAQESELFRSRRLAFEEILRLVTSRVQERLVQ